MLPLRTAPTAWMLFRAKPQGVTPATLDGVMDAHSSKWWLRREASLSAHNPFFPPLNLRLLSKRSVCSSRLCCRRVSSASPNSSICPRQWPPSIPPCSSCRAQQSSYVITALWSLSRTFFSPDATQVGLDLGGPVNPSAWHLPDSPGIIFLSAAAQMEWGVLEKDAVSKARLSYRA